MAAAATFASSLRHDRGACGHSGRVVVGFEQRGVAAAAAAAGQQQQQHSSLAAEELHAREAAAWDLGGQNQQRAAARSLLSELLKAGHLEIEAAVAMMASRGSGQGGEEEAASTDDEDEPSSDGMGWEWMEGHTNATLTESDDRSSLCSQPIPIPASCWFKDEMQRAALEKLNQKRKHYYHQLEAERLVAKSMAKSRQAAAAARPNVGRVGGPAGRPA